MTFSSNTEQRAFFELISIAKESSNLNEAFDPALEHLIEALEIDRALLWQIVIANLTVTNSASKNKTAGPVSFSMNSLEGTPLVLAFLSELDDKDGINAIEIHESKPSRGSPTDWQSLSSALEGFRSNILVPMRARGKFIGFLMFQKVEQRAWSNVDAATLLRFGDLAGLLLSYEFDVLRLEQSKNSR